MLEWNTIEDKFKYLCIVCIEHLIGSIRVKLYLDKDVLDFCSKCVQEKKRCGKKINDEDTLAFSLLFQFLLLSFVIHSKWCGQIIWNVWMAIVCPIVFYNVDPVQNESVKSLWNVCGVRCSYLCLWLDSSCVLCNLNGIEAFLSRETGEIDRIIKFWE